MAETNPSPPTAPTPRSPGWMRLLLVASLALNLLVIGMIGGAILSGGGPGAARDSVRELGGSPFIRALDERDRRAIARQLFRERETLRETRDALRDRFERLLAALRAEDFDAEALSAIVAEQRAAGEARQSLGERLVLERVIAMSAQERRAYADRLEQEVRQPRRR